MFYWNEVRLAILPQINGYCETTKNTLSILDSEIKNGYLYFITESICLNLKIVYTVK